MDTRGPGLEYKALSTGQGFTGCFCGSRRADRPIGAALALGILLGIAQPGLARDQRPLLNAPLPFKECTDCPEMVPLPAGSFTMGDDRGRQNVGPAVPITLSRPFAIARTETTWDQWTACVADGACEGGQDDHAWGRGNRPMINITWDQARDYAAWLSAKTGATYRLPTEAEWEYAARAGTDTPWWFGETMVTGRVNCRHCDPDKPWDARSSAPVGSYPPNPWGLSDMNGNVWEFTLDCWSKTHAGAPPDGSARPPDGSARPPDGSARPPDGSARRPESQNGEDCRDKTMRGGAWYYKASLSASTGRARADSHVWSYVVGFRVVREPPFPASP
ncbi:formylglycine-generating enzyme family protein [Rhodospirillum sp. A1_3_36]|uniref:formylglycine-generating enzyme family protein n=1 Tax=Rhodospirillum sp. A1_3_36 TaxID=3391666 RepID=UPI0039A5ACF2